MILYDVADSVDDEVFIVLWNKGNQKREIYRVDVRRHVGADRCCGRERHRKDNRKGKVKIGNMRDGITYKVKAKADIVIGFRNDIGKSREKIES